MSVDTPCREYQGAHDGKGYGWARIQRDGKTRQKLVHRLVVERALGRELASTEVVMHICDNPPCFRFDHLKIGTKGENNTDRARKGRNGDHSGERHGMAKLTADQVREIRIRAADGESRASLATTFGISRTHVGGIVTRTFWKAVT